MGNPRISGASAKPNHNNSNGGKRPDVEVCDVDNRNVITATYIVRHERNPNSSKKISSEIEPGDWVLAQQDVTELQNNLQRSKATKTNNIIKANIIENAKAPWLLAMVIGVVDGTYDLQYDDKDARGTIEERVAQRFVKKFDYEKDEWSLVVYKKIGTDDDQSDAVYLGRVTERTPWGWSYTAEQARDWVLHRSFMTPTGFMALWDKKYNSRGYQTSVQWVPVPRGTQKGPALEEMPTLIEMAEQNACSFATVKAIVEAKTSTADKRASEPAKDLLETLEAPGTTVKVLGAVHSVANAKADYNQRITLNIVTEDYPRGYACHLYVMLLTGDRRSPDKAKAKKTTNVPIQIRGIIEYKNRYLELGEIVEFKYKSKAKSDLGP